MGRIGESMNGHERCRWNTKIFAKFLPRCARRPKDEDAKQSLGVCRDPFHPPAAAQCFAILRKHAVESSNRL